MTSNVGGPNTALYVATLPEAPTRQDALREAAQDLEANFIAEMLKAAKFGEPLESFGGGIGEEQFSSFLRNEHASALAEKGGFGLADAIFESLVEREDRLSDRTY